MGCVRKALPSPSLTLLLPKPIQHDHKVKIILVTDSGFCTNLEARRRISASRPVFDDSMIIVMAISSTATDMSYSKACTRRKAEYLAAGRW